MKTELFPIFYKIKVCGVLGKIKKIYNAVTAALTFITIGVWETSCLSFITIFGRAVNKFLAGEFKSTYGRCPRFNSFTYRGRNTNFFAHTDKLFPFNINPRHRRYILPKEINVARVCVVNDFIRFWIKPGRFKMRLGDYFFGRPISEFVANLLEKLFLVGGKN